MLEDNMWRQIWRHNTKLVISVINIENFWIIIAKFAMDFWELAWFSIRIKGKMGISFYIIQ